MTLGMSVMMAALFVLPFLGGLLGGYLVNFKSRRMRVNAKGIGEVFRVDIDVDTGDAQKAVEQLRGLIDDAIGRFAELNRIAKAGVIEPPPAAGT